MVLVDRLLDVCEFDVCELYAFLLAALRSILFLAITSSQDNIAVHQLHVSETAGGTKHLC